MNKVGIDLNTASVSLLEYISGISKAIAKNEEINASKIELFSRFEIFSKICIRFSIVILVLLVIWNLIR